MDDLEIETPPSFLRIIIALIFPPVGAFLKEGFSLQFFVNVLLTLLGYVPGMVHAVWLICRKNK